MSTAIAFMEGFKKIILNMITPGDPFGMVRHVLFVVKCIYFHRPYREMPFPKNALIYCCYKTPSVT